MSSNVKGIMKQKGARKSASNKRVSVVENTDSRSPARHESRSKRNERPTSQHSRQEIADPDSFFLHMGSQVELKSRTSIHEVQQNTNTKRSTYDGNPWTTEEKIPRHIKSLRSFIDKPVSQDDKKQTIKTRAATATPSKYDMPPSVVLDMNTAELGNLAYFHGANRDESLQQVSLRHKSWRKDKAIAANMYNARLRLKCYNDEKFNKPVTKKKQPPPQPLVIPPAYAQLFIREYGSNYSTLEEASVDFHKKRSASKESHRRNSQMGDNQSKSRSSSRSRQPSGSKSCSIGIQVSPRHVGFYDDFDTEEVTVREVETIPPPRTQHEQNKLTSLKIREALFADS